VSITAPAGGASVNGIVNVTADATDDVGVARVQFLVDGVDTGSPDSTAPYALAWDTRSVPNGAHTLRARAIDAAGNTRLSAGVDVNVSNASSFQNEILVQGGLNLPTAMKFLPDGRPAGVGAAGQDPGAAAAVHERGLEPVPADHEHRRGRCSAGDLRLRPRPQLRHQPLLLRLLHARVAQPRSGVAVHGERPGHRHAAGSELVLYEDTRTPTPSTTAAR
jgi:hypothetical protein